MAQLMKFQDQTSELEFTGTNVTLMRVDFTPEANTDYLVIFSAGVGTTDLGQEPEIDLLDTGVSSNPTRWDLSNVDDWLPMFMMRIIEEGASPAEHNLSIRGTSN